MLPSELLLTRKRGDMIYPVFLEFDSRTHELISDLTATFKAHVGRCKRDLWAAIAELEEGDFDYRQVRGLATILERTCTFERQSEVDPQTAREELFSAAAERIPTTDDEREAILSEVAAGLGVSPTALERSLYADLDDELILTHFEPIDAETLLRKYNLGITQTLLFQCVKMSFTKCKNWHHIFGHMKRLGLMYMVQRRDDDYWVETEGPGALLRLNRRYGTRLATLLPQIVASPSWQIEAQIVDRYDRDRVLRLELDDKRHGKYLRSSEPEPVVYDSMVEQDFAERFTTLNSGWRLVREPGPIPAGDMIMLPDFMFERFGVRVYLEVAGFWTPEYLERKLRQLTAVKDVDLIVAADESHACQELDRLRDKMNVIYYKGKVPLASIIRHLRAREAEIGQRQSQEFVLDLRPDQLAVSIADIAEEMGVLETVVKDYLERHEVEGYVLMVDTLVSEELLREIETVLNERLAKGTLTFGEASTLIEQMGAVHASRILDHLGFHVDWSTLDPDDAVVSR